MNEKPTPLVRMTVYGSYEWEVEDPKDLETAIADPLETCYIWDSRISDYDGEFRIEYSLDGGENWEALVDTGD